MSLAARAGPRRRAALLRPRRAFLATLALGIAVLPGRPAGPQWPGGRISPVDGLEYVRVPAGTFMMGCVPGDGECQVSEKPRHRVTLTRPFWVGRTEVTVAAYRRFVESTGYRPASDRLGEGWGAGGSRELTWVKGLSWRTPIRAGEPAPGDWPVTQVSHTDALVFCRFSGGALPTEAQWEYAVRRGRAWTFPWGPVVEWARDENLADESRRGLPSGSVRVQGYWDGFAELAPVGSFPPGPFGLCDVAGNAAEWCLDWLAYRYYETSPDVDPRGPAKGTVRAVRGGSYAYAPSSARISARGWNWSGGRYHDVGFRCILPESAWDR